MTHKKRLNSLLDALLSNNAGLWLCLVGSLLAPSMNIHPLLGISFFYFLGIGFFLQIYANYPCKEKLIGITIILMSSVIYIPIYFSI